MLVANYTTKRILVDNSSLTDILFYEAFSKLGINQDRLQSSLMLLRGFSSETL